MNKNRGKFNFPQFEKLDHPQQQSDKSNKKFRLRHNLSPPYDGSSVNENIPKEHTSVQYATIRDATPSSQFLKKK